MAKDYKERPVRKKAPARNSRNTRKSAAKPRPRWPSFLVGLVVGVVATVLVLRYDAGESLEQAVKAAVESGDPKAERSTRFEFYTVLPEKEIAIPDSELEDSHEPPAPVKDKAAPAEATTTAAVAKTPRERYLLQVGSFRSLEDADRLKAKLAFLGLESSIQTVSLDGRETWHRVHVGPYQGRAELAEARGRLQDNKFDAMVLKLK